MPVLVSRAPRPFNLSRLGREIAPGERIHVTAAEAKQVAGHPLLDVEADPPKETRSKIAAPAADDNKEND